MGGSGQGGDFGHLLVFSNGLCSSTFLVTACMTDEVMAHSTSSAVAAPAPPGVSPPSWRLAMVCRGWHRKLTLPSPLV